MQYHVLLYFLKYFLFDHLFFHGYLSLKLLYFFISLVFFGLCFSHWFKIRTGRDVKYLLFIYEYTAQTVGEPFGLDCKNRGSLQKLLYVKNNNINSMHVKHMATISVNQNASIPNASKNRNILKFVYFLT